MKRWLGLMVGMLAVSPLALAGTSVTMDGPMTDGNAAIGVSGATMTYTLNLDDHNIDYASAQVIVASDTIANKTFNDGQASTFTMTVVTATSLSTAAATGSFTMVSASLAAGAVSTGTVAISSNQAGVRIHITGPPGDQDYATGSEIANIRTATDTAVSFMTVINASSNTTGIIAQVNTSSTILTLAAISSGTFGNAWAVTSSSPTAISTAAFSGGINATKVTIGGYAYVAGVDFVTGASTGTMAQALSQAIYNSSATTLVTSTATFPCTVGPCGVVFTTATVAGLAGNYALASSNALAISTSGATMTGGLDNATFCINGTCLQANKHWYPTATAVGTAQSIYAAINSSFTIVVSTEHGGVVYTTATTVGSAYNYATYSSTSNALLLSNIVSSNSATAVSTGTMFGGFSSSFTVNTPIVFISSHGYSLGLGVWVSSTAGTSKLYYSTATTGGTATEFAQNTTYYAIPLTANTLEFATTSTGAVAGSYITFVSSQAKSPTDTYTLNAPAIGGNVVWAFYMGNDAGINGYGFFQATSSTTISSYVNPSTSTFVDFGNTSYKYLQMRLVPPNTGAASVKAIIHGEKR